MRLRSFAGRNEGELFRGVANDFALRQRLLQFINLCLGEVGVAIETHRFQLCELLQTLHGGQLVAAEPQRL